MLERIGGYIDFSVEYKLIGQVADKPEDLQLWLFVDADFAGDQRDTKSTSGGFSVLAGPNSWFPLRGL